MDDGRGTGPGQRNSQTRKSRWPTKLAKGGKVRAEDLRRGQAQYRITYNPASCYYKPARQTVDIGGHDMAAGRKYRNAQANPRSPSQQSRMAMSIDKVCNRYT